MSPLLPPPSSASPGAPEPLYDLRTFFHNVGHFSAQHALLSTTAERLMPEVPAELLDEDVSVVDSERLEPKAFVDGIQASICVTHRSHRPVYLNYVAAGALGPGSKPVGLLEKLSIVCSSLDREWVDSLGSGIPVDELPHESPPSLENLGVHLLSSERERLERALVESLVASKLTPVVCDGSLLARPYHPELVGVVKTTSTRYLADESCLYRLPAGSRSPRFKLPGGRSGSPRYSAYLRLVDASTSAWDFGLIRLEAFDPELLDPLAALCLSERQNIASGDARWDRHLTSVHACEEFLRARRPAVYSL